MSEKETGGQPDQSSSGDSQDKVAYSTYQKVMGELKRAQKMLDEVKAKEEAEKAEKLAAQGKHEELIQQLKRDLEKERTDRGQDKKKFMSHLFTNQVKSLAMKAGVNQEALDDIVRVGNWGEVEFDEENLAVKPETIQQELARMQKEKSYLFSKQANPPKDVQLSNGKPVAKDPKEMSSDELIKAIKSLS
jgi:hypothetical protein